MSMIFQVIAAIIGVMAFAALFRAPRRYYLDCGITGGIGWLIYLLVMQQGFSTVIASLVATLALTILSRMLSVWRQAPVTIFLVTSIFTLVPGAGIYYTAYYLIMDQIGSAAAKITVPHSAKQITSGVPYRYCSGSNSAVRHASAKNTAVHTGM